jgi:hypothetical protein
VTRILKLSAGGFEIDSDDVKRVAFTFGDPNAIQDTTTPYIKTTAFHWLKA